MKIKPEAAREIAEAVAWYSEISERLGDRFESALENVLEQIEVMPELHRVVYRGVRRAITPRFPFAVYYRIDAGEVIVLAVVHARRDPEHWKSRD